MVLLTKNTPEAPTRLIDRDVLSALRPPRRLAVREWTEQHIRISEGARPGPLDHRNAPYLPGILELATTSGVAQLNVMKAGQIGVTAAMLWLLAYWASNDPDPCGLTLPDEKKGRKIVTLRLLPFLRKTPAVARLLTGRAADLQSEIIKLRNSFLLHLMWAGSATSTSSDPMRRVINDEVDKMGVWGTGGGEGHAVNRTRTRLKTYEDRAIQINVSTPDTNLDMMNRLFENSHHQLYYLVPCPECNERIRFIWDQVKFSFDDQDTANRREWAERVMTERHAVYECQACGETFDDRGRRLASQHGWYGTIDPETNISDGRIEEAESIRSWPAGTTIGIHVSELPCMWSRLWRMAHDFILAVDDLEAIYAFRTERLGEPFEQRLSSVKPDKFSILTDEAETAEGLLPPWTDQLIATVDTQKDHFYLVIRAWGPGLRSRRVFHQVVHGDFQELERLCFRTPWKYQTDASGGVPFPPQACDIVLIDTGAGDPDKQDLNRTMQVYAWALEWPDRVIPIKGDAKPRPGVFQRKGRGWFRPADDRTASQEVPLWMVDSHHYHSALDRLIDSSVVVRAAGEDEDESAVPREPRWQLNQHNDSEYNRHLAGLQLTTERKGDKFLHVWRPTTSGARHDYRDCEAYQVCAAYLTHINLLPELDAYMEEKRAAARPRRKPTARGDGDAYLATDR